MDILSNFPERLSELMAEHRLTPLTLGNKMNIHRNTVNRYLQGTRLPSFECLVKLLDIFNCSADFLLGAVEYPSSNIVFHPIPPFQERFRALLVKHKMSQYALHQKTKISYDTFSKWLKGVTSPFADNLIKLSAAFDCSVDYLIGHVL